LKRLQFFAGLKAHCLTGRDGDFRARAGVAADAGLSWFYIEDAETAELNAVSVLERFLHVFKNRLDRHLSFCFCNAGLPDHFVDDIEFDQVRLRSRQLDDRVEVTGMSSNAAPPLVPAVDSSVFRTACGKFATGITIVTVIGNDGLPHGMTANSFTSVSLDPPLVLVCIDRTAAILPHLEASEHIGINVLAEDQQVLSAQFARRGTNRFEAAQWFPGELGVPLLEGVLANYECAISEIIDAGDHRIFIAEVRHLRCFAGRPLLYFASGYRSLA
jgi:flavin reductase (DIM6/NTAB) family NADH-FMN oxidoreductase RutF